MTTQNPEDLNILNANKQFSSQDNLSISVDNCDKSSNIISSSSLSENFGKILPLKLTDSDQLLHTAHDSNLPASLPRVLSLFDYGRGS